MSASSDRITLPVDEPLWERFFSVFPLVLVGTREPDGGHDLAPKHMAMPLSWEAWFGFVCTPRHGTYRNVQRTGAFTVSYPRAAQVVQTALAAAPRCDDDTKPALQALPVTEATRVDGVLVDDCPLCLECELDRFVDGLGENSLIIGRVLAAHVDRAALRGADVDDAELLLNSPLFSYLYPGRFAEISQTQAFPMPAGFKR
jgi:flavin reductase (DIM6/NTAB) family NADH-FMN oxidoreductase RutF